MITRIYTSAARYPLIHRRGSSAPALGHITFTQARVRRVAGLHRRALRETRSALVIACAGAVAFDRHFYKWGVCATVRNDGPAVYRPC